MVDTLSPVYRSALTPELAQRIWEVLDAATSILLHFHPIPDGDSMGSALGLAHALRNAGKQVTVIAGDSPIPDYLAHLPGVDTVEVTSFSQVDQSRFDTFVVLDSATLKQISRTGEVTFAPHLRTVIIDHHATNPGYGDLAWVDSTSPAVAQLVYELLAWKKIEIPTSASTCLLVGLFTDTGGYQYPPTSQRTFLAAAALAAIAPDYHTAIFPIENTFSPQHLAYQGVALRNVTLHPLPEGKQLAISKVSYEELRELGIPHESADKSRMANLLKSVVGWDVGVAMVEIEPGTIKVSFRTRNAKRYHLGNLAAKIGGGGHPAAAATVLHQTLLEAEQSVVSLFLGN